MSKQYNEANTDNIFKLYDDVPIPHTRSHYPLAEMGVGQMFKVKSEKIQSVRQMIYYYTKGAGDSGGSLHSRKFVTRDIGNGFYGIWRSK